MEIWDLYDENRQPLGRTHIRGNQLTEGEYHIVTDVWTVRDDGKILITKRHPNKIWGNMWECTGGSALIGESSEVSAARELAEEVGISVNPEDLQLINSVRVKERFVDTYAVLKNVSESELKLQETEVVDAKFVDFTELEHIWRENLLVPRERFSYYRQALKNYVEHHRKK